MKYWIHLLIARLIRAVLFLILSTCRIKIIGIEHFTSVSSCIAVFWHNRMSLTPNLFFPFKEERNFTAVISRSKDGNILDCLMKSYGSSSRKKSARTIRVAHNQRERAVREMIAIAKEDHSVLMVTPDGPRGPCYKAKPGAIAVAKESGSPLLPLSWEGSSFWELSSWDRFRIPKPFSTITVAIGKPLYFAPSNFLPREEELKKLQTALLDIDKQAKELLDNDSKLIGKKVY